jgi:RNA polymerase sigma-70 factor (ECF subfamily)
MTEAHANRSSALFDRLYCQHHDRIYRLIYRVVGDQLEAEDLTQETFMRLYDHLDRLEIDRVHHWLHRVAVNYGLKAIRGRKRFHKWQDKAKHQVDQVSQPKQQDPLKATQVREVLARLSERQSQLLLLHTAGFSYEELATAIDVKRSSISQLLGRARQAFEQEYRRLDNQKRRNAQ